MAKHQASYELHSASRTFTEPENTSGKYFYDERGAELLDDICDLNEYYVTRTESSLMRECVAEIAGGIGPDALLVEYGSGSSLKTCLLFRNLIRPAGYVPINISGDYLSQVDHSLQTEFLDIEVMPVIADFDKNRDVLHAGYNDSKGVTAQFNLNVLKRINDELDGGFDLGKFC